MSTKTRGDMIFSADGATRWSYDPGTGKAILYVDGTAVLEVTSSGFTVDFTETIAVFSATTSVTSPAVVGSTSVTTPLAVLGASGTAGKLRVFPTTALKGKLEVTVSDASTDTLTTVNVAAQAGARTYTVPDAGASASFVMTGSAAQVIAGDLTVSGTFTNAAYTQSATTGSFSTSVTTPKSLTATSVGAVTTGATTVAEEHGDGVSHVTKLTMTAFSLGTGGDNENLAIGNKFYTFPAGTIVVEDVSLVGAITSAASVKTGTAEVGIGTVIGTGASATLSTTMEDYLEGGAAGATGGDTLTADMNGTTFYKGGNTAGLPVLVKTSGGKTHDMFLNLAVAWPDSAAAADCAFTGVITVRWRLVT